MVRTGFTLVEVIVALLLLQLGVLGVMGTLALASRTLTRAEGLDRAAERAEGVLDSLQAGAVVGVYREELGDVAIDWRVDSTGAVFVTASDREGGILLRARSRVPLR